MNINPTSTTTRLHRQTIIVNGRLAMRTERLRAARGGIPGVQVMAIEHLVERLAGGFLQMVDTVTLKKVIAKVLPETDVGELEPIKDLPGMVSAAAETLMKFWLSDSDIETVSQHSRIKSVLALEQAVIAELPAHMRRPGDLIRIALARAQHSKKIFGKVIFRGHTELHPVWRPILTELAIYIDVVWDAGPRELPSWYREVPRVIVSEKCDPDISSVSCATARHEVIESVRWARDLMAKGVKPADIAIATVATSSYDDHFITVSNDTQLGLHIVQGISAVHRREGQTAAALTDLVLRGLSQKRVRRLVDLIGPGEGVFENLPRNWSDLLKEDATLSKLERWRKTLDRTPELIEVGKILLPVLELIDKREDGAAETGEKILSGKTLAIWRRALLDGPAAALDRTIQSQRIDDGEDPHSSPCYIPCRIPPPICPAHRPDIPQLAAACYRRRSHSRSRHPDVGT